MKLYDKSKMYEKLENMTKQKFQLLEFFNKFYNIIVNTYNSADCTAKFQKLALRMILLDNHT